MCTYNTVIPLFKDHWLLDNIFRRVQRRRVKEMMEKRRRRRMKWNK